MTTTEILALAPGPDLDRAVHAFVFAGEGKSGFYSTKHLDSLKILDRIPGMFVARIDPSNPTFKPERPWISGTLAHEPTVKGDVTRLRISAPTWPIALCKAALIYTFNPPEIQKAVAVAKPLAKIPVHSERPPMPVRKYVKPAEPKVV